MNGPGVRFDGRALFSRRADGAAPIVWATHFSELALDGIVEIRAGAVVDRLVLDGDRCEIACSDDCAETLDCTVRDGVVLVINGRTAPSARRG